ncbi:metallophosphoesterase [Rhodopila sp.]|jgi:serine/threonine protein phosphatase 1|uniref:metallophosphoesterase n=1 Tax=Rhodopila sp. TaxID=2480087 RepID=UPI002C7C6F7C|nr:metallophosphoesterase [Rhodopila sp.]HVZ07589.1 metallophosphoesterase [Rhodopila sp.]
MRRPLRRVRKAELEAADIATFRPRVAAATAESVRWLVAPGRMPFGRRAYVIGDVHGARASLDALHAQIRQDLSARPVRAATVVHLGDYIDQGPDSAGVIRALMGDPVPGARLVALLGDHERMLLDALDGDRAAATDWLWAGGGAALESWGLSPDLPREDWVAALPADQIAWLRGRPLSHREGAYLFVHAGLRPGVALDRQSRDDLLTIRQPFLSAEQPFEAVVVHGHSSVPAVAIQPNRIGLDTGAGMGGKLSCAVLEDDVVGLIAV